MAQVKEKTIDERNAAIKKQEQVIREKKKKLKDDMFRSTAQRNAKAIAEIRELIKAGGTAATIKQVSDILEKHSTF